MIDKEKAAGEETPEKETAPSVAETLKAFKEDYEKQIAELKAELQAKDEAHAVEVAELLKGEKDRKAQETKSADRLCESITRINKALGIYKEEK